jgi:hypothetical protein
MLVDARGERFGRVHEPSADDLEVDSGLEHGGGVALLDWRVAANGMTWLTRQ